MSALLSLRGVAHTYRGRAALSDVALDVQAGEVLGLLGPNGSGKSTLIAVLSGALPLQAGVVTLDGAPSHPRERGYRAQIGVVFQQPSLDGKLSVRENMYLAATMAGLRGAERAEVVRGSIELARLSDRSESAVGELSGGMRRRLDIARALLPRPRLLFMDEPSAGLDEASFRGLWAHLEAANRETGVTIVVSTHRPDEAARCRRVAVIDEGRIVRVATPAALCAGFAPDLVVVTTPAADAAAATIREMLGVEARVVDGAVHVASGDGHALVPRLFEALAPRDIQAVAVRRPDLADAFHALTGRGLSGAAEHAA